MGEQRWPEGKEYVRSLRALIVHSSSEIASALVAELERLGLSADSASSSLVATDRLFHERYRVLVLEDELPNGGSLAILATLEEIDERKPEVVMVSVPHSMLAEARLLARDGVEYVADPQTDTEVARLAMRIRTRLMDVGLAEDFAESKEQVPQLLLSQTLEHTPVQGTSRRPERRVVLRVIAVLAILTALLLILRVLTQSGIVSQTMYTPVETMAFFWIAANAVRRV